MTCAVLFDLDGTLLDSLDDLAHALNDALVAHHRPPATAAQTRGWIGDGVTTLCRRAAPDADEATIDSMRKTLIQTYERCCLDRSRLYPGIADLLVALHARGVPMAVLTNKPDALALKIVAALTDARWFCAVRGVREESERKPSPRLALQLAQQMQRRPAEVILVGDSRVDIETARAAEMHSIAVSWGFCDASMLQEFRPDGMISRPAELLSWVERHAPSR